MRNPYFGDRGSFVGVYSLIRVDVPRFNRLNRAELEPADAVIRRTRYVSRRERSVMSHVPSWYYFRPEGDEL